MLRSDYNSPSMARLPGGKTRARCTRHQQFQRCYVNETERRLFLVYLNGRRRNGERGKDRLAQDSGVAVRVWCRRHGAKGRVKPRAPAAAPAEAGPHRSWISVQYDATVTDGAGCISDAFRSKAGPASPNSLRSGVTLMETVPVLHAGSFAPFVVPLSQTVYAKLAGPT